MNNEQRKEAEAWFQFLRAFVVHTESVPKTWRVAQQSYMQTRVGESGQNLIVVQKMKTPVGTRYYTDVHNAIYALEENHKNVVLWIRRNGQQEKGRGCVPSILYPKDVWGVRRLERDVIAEACLALARGLTN
jgi:hypothetical protein